MACGDCDRPIRGECLPCVQERVGASADVVLRVLKQMDEIGRRALLRYVGETICLSCGSDDGKNCFCQVDA